MTWESNLDHFDDNQKPQPPNPRLIVSCTSFTIYTMHGWYRLLRLWNWNAYITILDYKHFLIFVWTCLNSYIEKKKNLHLSTLSLFETEGGQPTNQHLVNWREQEGMPTWRGGINLSNPSHSCNHKNLTPSRVVIDSSQITLTPQTQGVLMIIPESNLLSKVTSRLHILSWPLCWMNRRYTHNATIPSCPLPHATTPHKE